MFEAKNERPLVGTWAGAPWRFVWAVMLAGALPVWAAAPADAPAPKRFLFVVDTSSLMSRLAEPAQRTLFQLIENGLEGRMQTGDTLGLWTCSDRLAVDYPMQVWNNTERLVLAYRAMEHVKNQRTGKQGRLGLAISGMRTVIDSVKDLTTVILTDPANDIVGTPFDNEINAALRTAAPALRMEKKPAVVALLAEGGVIVKWSVNTPEAMISLPAPARAPQPAAPVVSLAATNSLSRSNLAKAEPKTPAVAVKTDPSALSNRVIVSQAVSVAPTNAAAVTSVAKIEPGISPPVAQSSPPAVSNTVALRQADGPAPTKASQPTNQAPAEPKPSALASKPEGPGLTNGSTAGPTVAPLTGRAPVQTNETPAASKEPALAAGPVKSAGQAGPPTAAERKPEAAPVVRRAPIILTRESVALKAWAEASSPPDGPVEPKASPPGTQSSPPTNVSDVAAQVSTGTQSNAVSTNLAPGGGASVSPASASVSGAPAVSRQSPLATAGASSTNLATARLSSMNLTGATAGPHSERLPGDVFPDLSSSPLPPLQLLASSPAEPGGWPPLVIGLGVAGSAALAGLLLWRRRAARRHPSLITRSLNLNRERV